MLATVKIVLKNVTLSGPPYRYAAIEGGSYALSATDTEITNYLRTRGLKVGLARIPLDTAPETVGKLIDESAEALQDRLGLVLGHER